MRNIHVDVTKDEIKLGIPLSARFCPVVLALSWRLPGAVAIEENDVLRFYATEWYVWKPPAPGHMVVRQRMSKKMIGELTLPPPVAEWIRRYDDGEAVEPFGFDLVIPDPLERVLWKGDP